MEIRCDLHTHTNHSDGSYTPTELVREAAGLDIVVALTDHNTVSGLPEFLSEAERLGVRAIGGTELSSVHCGNEFHILGLFIAPKYYARVEALCREYHKLKEESNLNLVKRLCDAGYKLDYSVIKTKNIKGNVNRAHIAHELVKGGYALSVTEAFDGLLSEKRGFYVPPRRLELTDAIRFLREIEALPILAHPLKDIDPEGLRLILPTMIEAGLVGMETMHSSYSDEKITVSKEIAREFGLLESGGSDFHGDMKPGIMLKVGKGNLDIPYKIYLDLKELHERLY